MQIYKHCKRNFFLIQTFIEYYHIRMLTSCLAFAKVLISQRSKLVGSICSLSFYQFRYIQCSVEYNELNLNVKSDHLHFNHQ
ncbi:hypothetical protein RhiirB3_222175 [Rhizophagus irregularis]|nr:hypothetical protein RhiirB3_222175 [Rhizophagus irregularis]